MAWYIRPHSKIISPFNCLKHAHTYLVEGIPWSGSFSREHFIHYILFSFISLKCRDFDLVICGSRELCSYSPLIFMFWAYRHMPLVLAQVEGERRREAEGKRGRGPDDTSSVH